MSTSRLLALYERGAVTGPELAGLLLLRINPEAPQEVLEGIPDEILVHVRDIAASWVPGEMASNSGTLPTDPQVAAAQAWLDSRSVSERQSPNDLPPEIVEQIVRLLEAQRPELRNLSFEPNKQNAANSFVGTVGSQAKAIHLLLKQFKSRIPAAR